MYHEPSKLKYSCFQGTNLLHFRLNLVEMQDGGLVMKNEEAQRVNITEEAKWT